MKSKEKSHQNINKLQIILKIVNCVDYGSPPTKMKS